MSLMTSVYDWFHHFFLETPVDLDRFGLYRPGCPDTYAPMPKDLPAGDPAALLAGHFWSVIGSRVGARWGFPELEAPKMDGI